MARNLGVPYTSEKPFYFVSYNSEDEARVAQYAKVFRDLNIPIWYDSGLKIGGEWEVEIAEKIEECQAVIMFLSKNIFTKENSYVHKEFELATEYSNKKVYVMMLDDIKKPEVPVRFRGWWTDVTRLQCINVYEFASPEECVRKLAKETGSAEISPQTQQNIPSADRDISVVIEMKKSLLGSQPADIYIDDEYLGRIGNGDFIRCNLPVGKSELKLRIAMMFLFKKASSLYAVLKPNEKLPKRISVFQNLNSNKPDMKVDGFEVISRTDGGIESNYVSPQK